MTKLISNIPSVLVIPLILILHFSACTENKCLKNRLSFDIGSGSTKYTFAQVDICEPQIIKIYKEESFPFKWMVKIEENQGIIKQEDLKEFSSLISNCVSKLNSFSKIDDILGVATQAFRVSKNGAQSLQEVFSKWPHSDIKIIDQKQEAELGYHYIKRTLARTSRDFMVWDIGGGSLQISRNIGGELKYYFSNLASESFKIMVIKDILKRNSKTPNPIGQNNIQILLKAAYDYALANVPKEFVDESSVVFGIGGVHFHSIKAQLKELPYNYSSLLIRLNEKALLSDHEIGGNYADTEVTNLALVAGFMKALNIKEVRPVELNLSKALLLQ